MARAFEDGGADADPAVDAVAKNLIWRVRILDLTEDEIVIERPSTLGEAINIEDNVELVGVMAVGQNRWMFHTRKLGNTLKALNRSKSVQAIRIAAPRKVERCQRRSFYRISTAGLILPRVLCWPILDPLTISAAERGVQTRIQMLEEGHVIARIGEPEDTLVTPEVGPSFWSALVNVGGGGVGLVVEPNEPVAAPDQSLLWLNIDLQPQIPAPIGVAGRVVHVHRDSEQRSYIGVAFEFSPASSHKRFIVDRICKYVTEVQREQLRRQANV